jgi:hypothetical protein
MLTVFAIIGAAALATPDRALAQKAGAATASTKAEPLSPDFKGAVGLGLIGAELGFVVPALAGARDAWEYIVFPTAGAALGAVGGYFLLEKGDGHPELAVGVLVAGMALFVPAMVLTVAETAYEPDEDEVSASSAGFRRAREAAEAGPGLLRLGKRGLLLAPPMVALAPSLTPKQALRTGATRAQAWQVSLLSGRF